MDFQIWYSELQKVISDIPPTPTPLTSLWRIAYENRYAAHPLPIFNFEFSIWSKEKLSIYLKHSLLNFQRP